MKRYLVTGGAGFIGSAIVRKLLTENNSVRVLDNESRGSRNRLKDIKKDIEFISGDIRDFETVNKALKGVDTVIHLAFVNGTEFFYEKPDLVLSVGVKGMINVLDGARMQGVRNLLLASSSEVYQTPPKIPTPETAPYFIPDPLNPRFSYAGGKIISEMMSLFMGKEYLKRVIIFRPHNVYGPDMGNEHVIPQLLTQIIDKKKKNKSVNLKIQGSGKETRAFIYIDDFVEGVIVLDKKGKNREIYNIGTDNEQTINNLIKIMGKVTQTKIKIIKSPKKEGSVTRRCPDITRIEALGFSPKTSLEEGLMKTFLWYNDSN